jgi:hypothetical protein
MALGYDIKNIKNSYATPFRHQPPQHRRHYAPTVVLQGESGHRARGAVKSLSPREARTEELSGTDRGAGPCWHYGERPLAEELTRGGAPAAGQLDRDLA